MSESEYNQKFQEMKSYIPFLETMITRLDIGDPLTNPRRAQLDKIKSLKDLLLNKKKRMKMENLLKCEQVLKTLHMKVAIQDDEPTEMKSSNFNFVRNKLKSVATKINQNSILNIDRDSDLPQVDYQTNEEPALFQRRPAQRCSSHKSDKSTSPQSSKHNLTPCYQHPKEHSRYWYESEKPLFSRRSPRDITQKLPSHKKEKRKAKKSKLTQLKDLNITLNVPEDKLSSLDTEDILSRIINCDDGDMDIATLRELRSQILGELKHTGIKDDISDLLLKSCKTSKTRSKKSHDVEDGELSDSESEALQNIYGNLFITNKDTFTDETSEKHKKRKIQLCLYINSDKNEKQSKSQSSKIATCIDTSDFESFASTSTSSAVVADFIKTDNNQLPQDKGLEPPGNKKNDSLENNLVELGNKESQEESKNNKSIEINVNVEKEPQGESKINTDALPIKNDVENELLQDKQHESEKSISFVSNFYNSTNDIIEETNAVELKTSVQDDTTVLSTPTNKLIEETPIQLSKGKCSVEIPLLNLEETVNREIVSEIDILQALKKEILGESITSAPETITPALHQPKITKVVSAQEIVKKRISIENYKQKCQDPPQSLYFRDKREPTLTEECKKQSLKLTEKECERFNVLTKVSLGDSSDDDNDLSISLMNVYNKMAPKSPDHEDFADTGIKPPVIIPCDPVKPSVIHSFVDIDMRNVNETEKNIKLNPHKSIPSWEKLQPNIDKLVPPVNTASNTEKKCQNMPNMPSREIASNTTPSPFISSGMTPNMVSNNTLSLRTYDISPRSDSENMSGRKHEYSPTVSTANTKESIESRHTNVSETGVWDSNTITNDMKYDSRDSYRIMDRPQTPIHSYGRLETTTTPLPSYNKLESPSTPLPLFGRMERPTTPLPLFGRNELGMTPINSYTRVDGSSTPIHQYGRPVHSFGQQDGSRTPTYSYYYSEGSKTPSHTFESHESYGRSDYSRNHSARSTHRRIDPRFNRSSDYDKYNRDREYVHYRERQFYCDYSSEIRGAEYQRHYEQDVDRAEMSRYHRNQYSERYNMDNASGRNQFNRYTWSKKKEIVSRQSNRDQDSQLFLIGI